MKTKMKKCERCGRYTLKATCACGGKSVNPVPARFSPLDPYGKYRRKGAKF
jgi:H/ACA ribonucleoprotein complex subunit 3